MRPGCYDIPGSYKGVESKTLVCIKMQPRAEESSVESCSYELEKDQWAP